MWTPTEFSYRKFRRKADDVGVVNATISAAELVSRRVALWPIIKRLYAQGMIKTVSRNELPTIAESTTQVTSEKISYGPVTAPFVTSIESGLVLPRTGLAMDQQGRFLNEGLFPPGRGERFIIAKIIWQLFHGSPRVSKAVLSGDIATLNQGSKQLEVAAPLIPRYNDNYYHWTVETLPQIRYLLEYESNHDMEITYLVPGNSPSWLEQTLDLLGIPTSQVEFASHDVYEIDTLLLPSFPLQSTGDFEWIQSSVLENSSITNPSQSSAPNVYISREKAVERRVLNEPELIENLSQYGFESYRLEDNSVEENVSLFHNANFVVGPHGAGLTDLIYCGDSVIIELFGSKYKEPYRRLANTCGLTYDSLNCTPKSTDIIVDADKLCAQIEQYQA